MDKKAREPREQHEVEKARADVDSLVQQGREGWTGGRYKTGVFTPGSSGLNKREIKGKSNGRSPGHHQY